MSRRAIGHHFFIIDNHFILHFDSEVYRKYYPMIDFESFEIIVSNGSSFHYFKDKQHVYLDSYMNSFAVLPDADPNTFQVLDFENGIGTSSGNDYIFNEKLPYPISSYHTLSAYYQSNNEEIYFNYLQRIPEADAATFEVLHADVVGNVAKDKYHVYFRDKIVAEADAETFEFLEACFSDEYYQEQDHTFYVKDKNQAYYINTIAKDFKVIKTKNIALFDFKIINELGYAFDGAYHYLYGKRIKL